MGALQLGLHARQTQTLSPRQQHAVQLLQMSSLDFSAMVRGQLDHNPFLEEDETMESEGDSAEATGQDCAVVETNSLAPDPGPWDAGLPDKARQHDGDVSAMDLAVSHTTLAMHLRSQLQVMPLSARELHMATAIVESLDDDGYLRSTLEELAACLPLRPRPQRQELSIALRRVQSLDPLGVGARNVAECLKLQTADIQDADIRQLALLLIDRHLPLLASRDMAKLARATGLPEAQIDKAVHCIRRFHPHPGWAVESPRTDYITPDVLVRKEQGQWRVQLNPAVIPRVRLNTVYEALFQRHRSREHAGMVEHLQEAKWTLRNVAQRFATILDVAQAIVARQHLFLEYGAMAMKPMLLREIADAIGVHESTVSRVTNNKYLATPCGVFELKHFFSRPMISASGKACSPLAIRELISDIIHTENPSHAWSDGEITRQLAAQGLIVARRTVTKYRQLLRIEPADKRKQM